VRRKRQQRRRSSPVAQRWTIKRATGLGVTAGLAALVLWPAYAAWQEPVLPLFIAALLIAAFCGLSILWITANDMSRNRRGGRIVPFRTFDLAVGIVLAVPSLLQLHALLKG
jgi:drug/metabolite transporter (DMT)-like permease